MAKEDIVVVAVDGSEASKNAVRWAANTAMKRGIPLRIASRYTMPQFLYAEGMVPPKELFEDLQEETLEKIEDARAVQAAGAFAVVMEMVPAPSAAEVTRELRIPTIGIGAGGGTDAQIQVFHDLLGLLDWTPRHSRHYAELGSDAVCGLTAWRGDVATGQFPTAANSSSMDDADLRTAVARVDSAGTRRPTAADAHDMNEAGSQVHRRRG